MNTAEMRKKLSGCYLAIPTMFKDDLSLNLDGMQTHVRFMLDGGLGIGNATLLVNGASGEFPVLNVEERKQTLEAVLSVTEGKIAVIAGAQSTSTRDAVEIAVHAQACGATALQVSAPFYYRLSEDDVYEYFETLAGAAPELAIVAYNTYWLGFQMSIEMLERLCQIPQVVTVKWGAPSFLSYLLVLRKYSDKLGIIDNQLTPVLCKMMGGIGANLHPAMFWPEWGARVWGLLEAGKWDDAQNEIYRLLLPYYEIIGDVTRFSGGEGHIDKLALEVVGLPGGRNRPPTRPLPPVFRDQLLKLFKEVGVPMNR